jgi:hypothetical protein
MALGLFFAMFGTAVARDTYYDKFGFWDHDIAAYKQLSITSCRTVQEENKDPMHPLANAAKLQHFVRLYAQCQRALEAQNAELGVLRVNSMGLGLACFSLAAIAADEPVADDCNIKSYLPEP